MVRIAVLVSGGGTNLQALIDAQGRGEIPDGQIAAVISSSPDAFALERAKKAGIPGYVINRKDFASNQAMTVALTQQLKELDIGLVVLAGFLYILTPELIDAYPNAILNVHPALIPSFCGEGFYGLHVHEAALAYGVKVTGATVHFVSEDCDGGPSRGFAAAGNGAGRVEDPAPCGSTVLRQKTPRGRPHCPHRPVTDTPYLRGLTYEDFEHRRGAAQ